MNIRKATYDDIEALQQIFEIARKFMRDNGNYKQWTNGYPKEEVIKADIDKNQCYLLEDNNEILATFVIQEDIDENYNYIEGSWLNEESYVAIHRIASSGKIKGVLKRAFDYALTKSKNIKCDTHEDNIPMQKALLKLGFKYCGIIYLKADNTPRFAYQYIYD